MRRIQQTASIERRVSWAGQLLLPSPLTRWGRNPSQISSVISWRRCAAVMPPPSTLSLFSVICHPIFDLTTFVKPLRSGRGSCGSDQIDSGTQTHKRKIPTQSRDEVASQAGFEPAASCLEGSRSIH